MLPAAFVRATLAALDLPRHLAQRYATAETGHAPPARSPYGNVAQPPRVLPHHRAPAWPFPPA